jgi:N-acetylmuramoyl-L-alanine amidase
METHSKIIVPQNFDHLQALRIVGYDIRDTSAAKLAFKRHFLQDTTRTLNEVIKKVLWTL